MSLWVSKVCVPSITPSPYLPLSQDVQVNESREYDEPWSDDITANTEEEQMVVRPPTICFSGLDTVVSHCHQFFKV